MKQEELPSLPDYRPDDRSNLGYWDNFPLIACEHCGSIKLEVVKLNLGPPPGEWRVHCQGCRNLGPPHKMKAVAIGYWNTRWLWPSDEDTPTVVNPGERLPEADVSIPEVSLDGELFQNVMLAISQEMAIQAIQGEPRHKSLPGYALWLRALGEGLPAMLIRGDVEFLEQVRSLAAQSVLCMMSHAVILPASEQSPE